MIAFEWLLFIFKCKYQIFSKLHCWNVASHKLRLKFLQETGNEKNAFVVWEETDRCHYSIWKSLSEIKSSLA